jgi:hypothetical protein
VQKADPIRIMTRKQTMPAFILLSGGILAFAVTYELLALQYHPAALVALFRSLPVSQQISWTVIGLAPIALMLFALVQHCRPDCKAQGCGCPGDAPAGHTSGRA